MLSQIKQFFKNNEGDVILVAGIVLISLISFGAGWLMGASSGMESKSAGEIKIEDMFSENLKTEAEKAESGKAEAGGAKEAEKKEERKRENNIDDIKENEKQEENAEQNEKQSEEKIVASKNGEVYHYVWCSGAKRINEENKIYFDSKEKAKAAGYRPAKNCEGLE